MIIGALAFLSFGERMRARRDLGQRPRPVAEHLDREGQVELRADRADREAARQPALRSRVFSTVASQRGWCRPSSTTSARSMPTIVELKHSRRDRRPRIAAPSCRQSTCGEPSARITPFSANIDSASH
jgi:hypothetical protein